MGLYCSRLMGMLLVGCTMLLSVQAHSQRRQIDSLRNLLPLSSDSQKVVVLDELSWIYHNMNIDSAIVYARAALTISRHTGRGKLLARALNTLGSAKQASGEYDSALYFLNQSIQEYLVNGDSSYITQALNNIGIIYDEKGDYDKALQSYFKGLRIAQRSGDETLEAYILTNIGVVYKKEKQYGKVLEYYHSALEIYKRLNSPFGISVASGNIGSVMLQTGEYERSLEYSQIAKKGYEELGYVRYIPYTLGNMAIAYDSMHQYGNAESFYLEAYKQHILFSNHYEAAYNSKNLVFFYLKRGQPERAKAYADKAISLANKIGAKEMLRDSYQAMAMTNKQLGRFGDAYAYQLKYSALKDSLFEESKTKTILELEVRYESESKELRLSEQKVLLATNALELQQRKNQVTALILASLFILITGGLLYQNQRVRRKKQQQESLFQLQLTEARMENELQQDRFRISRELHDNIGSRLLFLYTATENLLNSPADQVEKKQQLSAFAKNTLHELRRTVWFINKDFIRLDELQSRFTDYFSLLDQSIQLTLTFAADSSLEIRSSIASSLFRVAQESVSNAIKHGSASRVEITLSLSGKNLVLTITDNGKGFEPGEEVNRSPGGNGLKNMKAHGEHSGGTLAISAQPNMGTTIMMSIPLD